MALQSRGLGIEAANEDLVAIEPAQVLVAQIGNVLRVFGMIDALPLGGEQLDELGSADDLGDRRNQRCYGSGIDAFRRHRDFFVAHRHSFFANAGSPPARLGPRMRSGVSAYKCSHGKDSMRACGGAHIPCQHTVPAESP